MPPSKDSIISRSAPSGSFQGPPKPPNDKIFYAGFGKNLSLEGFQRDLESQGHIWTSALRDRVNQMIHFFHINLGIGTTKELLIQTYEASATGYKGSQDFLLAFNRCEMEYFRAEIESLRSKYGLSKVLDLLKGAVTSKTAHIRNMESAKQRLDNRRLFAADVGNNKFCHRYRAMTELKVDGNAELATYFYGGFVYDAPMPNQDFFWKYNTPIATVEPKKQASSQGTATQHETISSPYALQSQFGSMVPSAQCPEAQMGSRPMSQSFALGFTAYEKDRMAPMGDDLSGYPDSYLKSPYTTGMNLWSQDTIHGEVIDCRSSDHPEHLSAARPTYHSEQPGVISGPVDVPTKLDKHNGPSRQIENSGHLIQVNKPGVRRDPFKRPRSSIGEEMVLENERLKDEINSLKTVAGADKSEIERLNQKTRALEDGAAANLKSQFEKSFMANWDKRYKRTITDLGPRFQRFPPHRSSPSGTHDNYQADEPRATSKQSESPGATTAAKRHRKPFKTHQKSSKKNSSVAKNAPVSNTLRDQVAKQIDPSAVLLTQQQALLMDPSFDGLFYES
ncbi:hypothetical protein BJ875DRAFT_454177 [Amylocarpus encephaloides]|uniref:Uncharacterized protein n=1 Tax=Amylocarpus encephaloides TaxID=45428 RepID=A0A9P7YPB5_9HELO|nr:hypothetical protein BJ875DRAFT_454177 [Amylocarpus encephaloides]